MSTIKLVCFDLDDTLIQQNSWVTLNGALGITSEEDSRLYDEYATGTLSYDAWMKALLVHYKRSPNATKEYVTSILIKYEFIKGAKECIEQLQNKGYEIALISGGINIVVDHVATTLGITHSFSSNTLVFDTDNNIKDIIHSGDERTAKTNYLKQLLITHDIMPHESVCIADGANDLEMFTLTGHGITFNGSDIEHASWKIIKSLDEVLAIIEAT